MSLKKVVVWGTGKVAEDFVTNGRNVEIVAIVDNRKKNDMWKKYPVYLPQELLEKKIEFDYMLIASTFSTQIKQQCTDLNMDMKKVVFLRLLHDFDKREIQELHNQAILEEIYPEYFEVNPILQNDFVLTVKMAIDRNEDLVMKSKPHFENDYCRCREMELVAEIVNGLPGDIAEVGVFRGDFASLINEKCPDKKFYLFDTFEGFNPEEAEREIRNGNCNRDFVDSFRKTSVELVMSKMKYPEKCIVMKGLFPQSLNGLETTFSFVSIDVDFEESILASLEYFYPRLEDGGYIFVHDYNGSGLSGVKRAVETFEKKYGRICKVPITDNCGTLVVTK